jgi:ribonuclease BN (tRNA processing enzyme)
MRQKPIKDKRLSHLPFCLFSMLFPWFESSRLYKVFDSHLRTDHAGDIADMWVGGWLNGRYTPMQIYGPSGSAPELGTKVHVDYNGNKPETCV